MSDVVIIGAGAVGVNAALFLEKIGFSVELIDSAADILQGAPLVSFINHGDGFEYYKPGHQRTGEYCVDGSMVKGLIYPLPVIRTSICSADNPIRFLISSESVTRNNISLEGFYSNAQHMHAYFKRQYAAVKRARGWSDQDAEKAFLRTPDSFWRKLEGSDFADINNVVGGCAGSSFGINMPQYYALLKAAMRKSGISFYPGSRVEAIEKDRDEYVVYTGGNRFKSKHVLLTSGHSIPTLVTKIRGVSTIPPAAGVYYLNAMVLLRLPATKSQKRLADLRHIDFTLQQEHGAMYACVVAPTATDDGCGAIYYPSCRGSQMFNHAFDPDHSSPLPLRWDELIAHGLRPDDARVQRIFEQACRLYPFLRDYAEVYKIACRPVFNAATAESDHGADRRVREIAAPVSAITSDGQITSWTSPKWTNAELVALMATDYVSCALRGQALSKRGEAQFGPTGLDVTSICEEISFFDLHMDAKDALRYAERQGILSSVVDTTLPQFAPLHV